MGVYSFIIGVIALLCSIIMIAGLVPGNLFVVFVVLSFIGLFLSLKEKTHQKFKKWGLVLNLLSLILLLLTGIALFTL